MIVATQIAWDMRYPHKKRPPLSLEIPDEIIKEVGDLPSWKVHDHVKRWLTDQYKLPAVAFLLVERDKKTEE